MNFELSEKIHHGEDFDHGMNAGTFACLVVASTEELAADLRQKKYSKSADAIDRFSQDIWNHRALPKEQVKKIRTKDKQRTQEEKPSRRAFPNDASLLWMKSKWIWIWGPEI